MGNRDEHMFQDEEEYVQSVLVDVCSRSFKLFSNLGDEQQMSCDTPDQFMEVLSFVKWMLEDYEADLYFLDPVTV